MFYVTYQLIFQLLYFHNELVFMSKFLKYFALHVALKVADVIALNVSVTFCFIYVSMCHLSA